MSSIKNVAVVGASGNVGKAIVDALLAADFTVTALTRASSNSTFPSGVAVQKVDYESVDSLKSALQGQDAVVSAAATAAIGNQHPIVDAAVATGVKRFIPSEFGVNTRIETNPGLKTMLQGKVKTLDYIIEKGNANPSFTWTGLTTGLFFDWGLASTHLNFNKDTRTAQIVDSGDEPFSPSNLPFIGKAVASILQKPEKTANKYLAIASFTTSQNQLLKILEEETGATWQREPVDSEKLNKLGNEKLSKGDYSAFVNFLQAYIYGDGGNSAVKPEANANALLGLQNEDPRTTIKAWLEGKL
ncbi:uncharacterized protein BCR38DRAFT_98117 [Pseudomassariella vexata]|uniref:NmrA-like domain-containing protein n=1 Tax=Pseudomassariella vexata TaxID=1141098 RepID=A0A1Y2EEN4_9PEZI|nr:uncharacterized protein BCR38DRAFT_98117 [Pseudomassariella vexata]ORY70031.1 hypothetical protein BCR38DRAFT_98117 [Pseudomassariella vexata]